MQSRDASLADRFHDVAVVLLGFLRKMLHRDLPFGLARHHAQAEPLFDQQSRPMPSATRQAAARNGSRTSTSMIGSEPNSCAVLPEDVFFIVLGYLSVAELLVVRQVSSPFGLVRIYLSRFRLQCSKWFKQLTVNRHLWINFLSRPSYPSLASTPPLETLSAQELEALVRRQFELARIWSPKSNESPPIPIRDSHHISMPNNESLIAMSSMDSWVAVASDLGGVYLCTPFSGNFETSRGWIRVFSAPIKIYKLSVAVWGEPERERVGVMWAGRAETE